MRIVDGHSFNDLQAFADCASLAHNDKVVWSDIFASEDELVEALRSLYIPKNRTEFTSCFKGYEYIYSFAYYVQKGWTLSTAQMRQAKRLALEIKKAQIVTSYID